MLEPTGGIAAARQSWKVWTRLRDLLRQAEQIRKLVADIASLESRVAQLEEKLGRDTGARCPSCLEWDS